MKLIFDQNLPPCLPDLLADFFPESLHVREVGLRDAEDSSYDSILSHESFSLLLER